MDGSQPPTDASSRSSKQNPRHVQLRQESQQKGNRRPPLKLSHSLLRDVATRQANKSADDSKTTTNHPSEQSPLLKHTRKGQDGGDPASDAATAVEWNPYEATLQETKSSWYLMLLTLAIGGYVDHICTIVVRDLPKSACERHLPANIADGIVLASK